MLKDGDKWINKSSNKVYTLIEDYNGLWYLVNREEGLSKSLSVSGNKMMMLLEVYFEKYYKTLKIVE